MERISGTQKRFTVLDVPTGGGKSLGYIASAILKNRADGGRTAILTQSKHLQGQLQRDFGAVIFDIRGKKNYACKETFGQEITPVDGFTVENAPCNDGYECYKRHKGCTYYDALREAKVAPIVSTNYHYWLAQRTFSDGLGDFSTIVLDEAHGAGDVVCAFMAVQFEKLDVDYCGFRMPDKEAGTEEWARWWAYVKETGAQTLEDGDLDNNKRQKIALKRLVKETERAQEVGEGWVRKVEEWGHGKRKRVKVTFCPVWPGRYLSRLVGATEKVVLTSATITAKTVELLGIQKGDYDFREFKSEFVAERRPFYYIPVAAINSRHSDESNEAAFAKIVKAATVITNMRKTERGLIHSVSYGRMRDFLRLAGAETQGVEFRGHESGKLGEALEWLKGGVGRVLVSPSAQEGVDLPDDLCRYQIILKVPFQDSRDPVTKARMRDDEEYSFYCVGQTISQMYGRVMRNRGDWGETFMLDSNWGWVRGKVGEYVPKWVWEAEKQMRTIPKPLQVGGRDE